MSDIATTIFAIGFFLLWPIAMWITNHFAKKKTGVDDLDPKNRLDNTNIGYDILALSVGAVLLRDLVVYSGVSGPQYQVNHPQICKWKTWLLKENKLQIFP